MNLALAAVGEVAYFRNDVEDIKDAVEEADLEDVVEVDLSMAMEEEKTICAVDKMLKLCDAMTDHNWSLTCHMTSIKINGTV